MTTRSLRCLFSKPAWLALCLTSLVLALPGRAQTSTSPAGVPTRIDAVKTNGQIRSHLAWPAEAARPYDILTSTNLRGDAWGLASPAPVAPANLIGGFSHTSANRARFYRVAPCDTTTARRHTRSAGEMMLHNSNNVRILEAS